MPAAPRVPFLLRLPGGPRPWLVAILVLAWSGFFWRYAHVAPGGSDSSGYFNMALHLRAGEVAVPARVIAGVPMGELSPYAYVPLGFRPLREDGALALTYPVGLPLLYAGAAALAGWTTGPKSIMLLHALGALVLAYALGRQAGLSRGTAALAVAALGTSPLFLFQGMQAMSDVPATFWCAAALWCAGRGTPRATLAAGIATGCAVLIRPTNALLLAPLAVALGTDVRRWLVLAAGGAPFAAIFLGYNHAAYGNYFETGYGSLHELLETRWLGPVLLSYARWLPLLFSPVVFAVLALPWFARDRSRHFWTHTAWCGTLLGFYAFYFHTQEAWWYQRFVLPVAPSLLVLSLVVVDRIRTRLPDGARLRLAMAAVWIAVLANAVIGNRELRVLPVIRAEEVYQRAARLARDRVPVHAVVVASQASGALFHGAPQTVLRWDMLDGRWPVFRDAARHAGQPIFAVLLDFERARAFTPQHAPGAWRCLHTEENLSLWILDPDP